MFRLPTKTQAFQLSLAVGKRTVFVVHFTTITHTEVSAVSSVARQWRQKRIALGTCLAIYSVLPVKLCHPIRLHSACIDSQYLPIRGLDSSSKADCTIHVPEQHSR